MQHSAKKAVKTAAVPRRLVSLTAAAEYAGCHPRTIRRRIADGDLTGYRFGPRGVRVDLDELYASFAPIPTAGKSA
jgi:excisionase family DNA binding protein